MARDKKIVIKIAVNGPAPDPETNTALPQCELMQFTGLTDKNGKEIYEGDLAKEPEDWESKIPSWPIVWEGRHGFWGMKGWDYECTYELKEVEIIGDLYENPELLDE